MILVQYRLNAEYGQIMKLYSKYNDSRRRVGAVVDEHNCMRCSKTLTNAHAVRASGYHAFDTTPPDRMMSRKSFWAIVPVEP